MCYTLNPLDQLHKKWILRNVLKHCLYTAHWTVQAPYTFKYLDNGSSIQNDNTDCKRKIFYRRTRLEASQ